jgi:hypothetical protein
VGTLIAAVSSVFTEFSAKPALEHIQLRAQCRSHGWNYADHSVNSTFFGLLAEFGEANIPLDRVAPKYFGLSCAEARRRAPAKQLPCRAFRLGGQKSPWLVSATDLAELIDARREKAG